MSLIVLSWHLCHVTLSISVIECSTEPVAAISQVHERVFSPSSWTQSGRPQIGAEADYYQRPGGETRKSLGSSILILSLLYIRPYLSFPARDPKLN